LRSVHVSPFSTTGVLCGLLQNLPDKATAQTGAEKKRKGDEAGDWGKRQWVAKKK